MDVIRESNSGAMDQATWLVERRAEDCLIVRVRSRAGAGYDVPDAVFSFRAGDPQYCKWEQHLLDQERSGG